jgi:hypothetical protein
VQEFVLEELFAGEVLEIRVVNPSLTDPFIGPPVNVLEQPDHEAGLDAVPAILAVERRYLPVDPVPIDLVGKLNRFVLHIDDLFQPGPEQTPSPVVLSSVPFVPSDATTESCPAIRGNLENEITSFRGSASRKPAI